MMASTGGRWTEPVDTPEIYERGAQLVNRSSLAALACLVYDILLTLPDEVRYVWSLPRTSATKWIYLFVRYLALATLIALLFVGTELGEALGVTGPPTCPGWYIFQAATLQAMLIGVHSTLAQRVYALYNRATKIKFLLLGVIVSGNAVMFGAIAEAVPHIVFDTRCIVVSTSPAMIACGLAPLIIDVILLGLTLAKSIPSAYRGRKSLLNVVVQDGTWAFIAVFVIFALNGICYLVVRGAESAVLYAWLYTVSAIVVSRLVINVLATRRPDGEDCCTAVELDSHLVLDSYVGVATTLFSRSSRDGGKGKEPASSPCSPPLSPIHEHPSSPMRDAEMGLGLPLPPVRPGRTRMDSFRSEMTWADTDSAISMEFAPPPPPRQKTSPESAGSVLLDDGMDEYEMYEPWTGPSSGMHVERTPLS